MAEYLTNNTDLKKVADAIREKGGTSAALQYPDGFVAAIGEITTGVELSIIVSVTSGSVVTATKGATVISGTSVNGSCTLIVPEAGTWSVQATLNGQTSNTASVSVKDSYAVSLMFFSATITVTVDSGASVVLKKGSTTIATKTSTGTAVFTVRETGTYTVEATKSGKTVSGTVSVVSGTTSYALTLSFISATLNDNDWDVISAVADESQGPNYWSVGDCKAITMDGTVGVLTLSNYTIYAFILGFDHNASLEGNHRIHFQLGKTALTNGTDVALCDSYYGTSGGAFRMNEAASNSGGWESSYMRTRVCGTSKTNYSGTIIAVIPASLRAALKSVTKYTNNTGKSEIASAVTATTDYFFLLSEFEVAGTVSHGNTNEKTKQAQYSYYAAGNSRAKNNHNAISTAVSWWLRSPGLVTATVFAVVDNPSSMWRLNASTSYGFAPAFCV